MEAFVGYCGRGVGQSVPMSAGKTSLTAALMGSVEASLDGDIEHVAPESAEGRASTPARGNHEAPYAVARRRCGIRCFGSTIFRSLTTVIFSAKLNVLLPLGPAAIVVKELWGKQGLVFILSLLGLVPMAERLGYVTEQLSFFTGDAVGSLLNCTFGNAPELIISIFALRNGLLRIVQQSLLGSVLSNMLLVLGFSFFSGGIVSKKAQTFDKESAVMNSGMLLMAVMSLLFPAVLHYTRTEANFGRSELALSRFSSCIMLVAYASYLVFQFGSRKTHADHRNEDVIDGEACPVEEEVADISEWEAIIWLAIFTVWISITSDYLVGAIEGAAEEWNMPISFISVIMLPVIGNAPEHATAIMFAMKDKIDLTLGIAIGSATQICMLGIPVAVLVGWIMGQPVDLNFQLFETSALFMTVLVVAILLQGTSNHCKGMLLVLCYAILAASFYVHVDAPSTSENSA
ncbi:hypothetical protein Taro_009546 [Colocasia esculenta]|uniref:Vacuolar cation/proton exchanger n=1 Tax=Colocasia esculenta TaxID=4460 RepID=A0A843U6T6_COLES|nr:hypothetical protein [Colocasia esculenta]